MELLGRSGSLEYAQERARWFAGQAVAALAGLKDSDAKQALIQTADFIGQLNA
jgi:geranylgeranyl pyrophosphate synthase